jgi:hypothetical protein
MYSQRDPQWKDLKINGTDYTLGTDGCLITCLAWIAGITPSQALLKLSFNGALVDWNSIGNIGLEMIYTSNVYDNDRVLKYISENGSCIVRVDWDGSPKSTTDTHFVIYSGNKKLLDPWTGTERATSVYPLQTGIRAVRRRNMADTVTLDGAKFTELVTKSTYWDAIVKLGISQPSDVEDLRRQIKEANAQVGAAQEEAQNTRKTLTEFQQQVADKLNSPQDLARILSAIQGLLDSEAQAVKNSEKDAFKLKEAETAILDLKSEINRLQLELKANKSLATATMLQMFTEIIERFKRILSGL